MGGAFIALATSLNLYLYGRITGLSGIFNSVIKYDQPAGFLWKFSFFIGLITPAIMFYSIGGNSIELFGNQYIAFDPVLFVNEYLSIPGLIVGGFLVGVGTRMGNGCTSGHGVCGIPRLSIRSIVATCTFIAAGMAMATLRYNYPFFVGTWTLNANFTNTIKWSTEVLYCVLLIIFAYFVFKNFDRSHAREYLISLVLGSIFGLGLLISGMCRISKIMGFLEISSRWDPSLMFVMASAVGINLITFHFILKSPGNPVYSNRFCIPAASRVDA